MAKAIHDINQLKTLLESVSFENKPKQTCSKAEYAKTKEEAEAALLHSYVRRIVAESDVYDILKDTEVDGISFQKLAMSCDDELSRDIVEYFAYCFFEGDYSSLDTFAMQCEQGVNTDESANASVLGHVVPMTSGQEFKLLAELFSIALMIDKRMDDEQKEVKIVYSRGANTDKQNTPLRKDVTNEIKATKVIPKNHPKVTKESKAKESKPHNACKSKKKQRNQLKITQRVGISNHQLVGTGKHKGGIVSSPSMRRKSFSSHIADTGVWGKIASYGGFNGRLIYINAGHGR